MFSEVIRMEHWAKWEKWRKMGNKLGRNGRNKNWIYNNGRNKLLSFLICSFSTTLKLPKVSKLSWITRQYLFFLCKIYFLFVNSTMIIFTGQWPRLLSLVIRGCINLFSKLIPCTIPKIKSAKMWVRSLLQFRK